MRVAAAIASSAGTAEAAVAVSTVSQLFSLNDDDGHCDGDGDGDVAHCKFDMLELSMKNISIGKLYFDAFVLEKRNH